MTLDTEEVKDPQAQDLVQGRATQHILNTAQFLMGSVAHDLKCGLPRASAIVLSVLGTGLMAFIRGYPRETWEGQFREIADYFTRMADEVKAREGDTNDSPTPN
jgi:hypothetical protein